MEEYNLYENYYVLLRDCTNLEVSRASSKILRRYFRRGREATWRFLESTFLDFQRNYYPCINYNPAQGSLLYSNGLEHCQYPVSTSPIPHSCMNIHYVGTKYMELPDHLKTSKTFSSTTQRSPNRDLKTSLSLRITSSYVTSIDRDSYHSILTVDQCSRSRFLSRVSPILGWRTQVPQGEEINVVRAGH